MKKHTHKGISILVLILTYSFFSVPYVLGANPQEESSFLESVSTLCIPTILREMEEYDLIRCEYINCYYKKLKEGGSVNECEWSRSLQTCSYVAGYLGVAGEYLWEETRNNLISSFIGSRPLGDFGISALISLIDDMGDENEVVDEMNDFFNRNNQDSIAKDILKHTRENANVRNLWLVALLGIFDVYYGSITLTALVDQISTAGENPCQVEDIENEMCQVAPEHDVCQES